MIIKNAEFVTSVANANKILIDEKPQIAFVGRSNVGKSSLINFLCGKNKLVKSSSTPGRTRLINYFIVNDSYYLVDLPGYGYAKASKVESDNWQGLIEPYLNQNAQLKCVCLLVDSRIKPQESDKQMLNYLAYYKIPFIIVATKVDKFAKSKIKPALISIANGLGVGIANIFGVSKDINYGKEQLLDRISDFLE